MDSGKKEKSTQEILINQKLAMLPGVVKEGDTEQSINSQFRILHKQPGYENIGRIEYAPGKHVSFKGEIKEDAPYPTETLTFAQIEKAQRFMGMD